jgi:glycosyltransferase involved in cell wall biosynthesis
MSGVVFAVAGALETRTGGSIYNRRMAHGLGNLGRPVTVVELDGGFPEPDASARSAAAEAFAAIPSGSTVVVDGLAYSALPDLAEAERHRLALVALVHLPVAAAFGLDHGRAARLAAGERRALAAARGIVITGPGARHALAEYGLNEDRVWLIEPGTDPAPLARGSADGLLRLLTVATFHAGKGHDLLLEALAPLSSGNWELTCAGSLTRDPETVERVRTLAATLGLLDRVRFVGDLPPERLDEHYANSDLFVLATRMETYGMAVAEAIARGLPVVSTDTGAITDIVGSSAGLVVPAGDGEAFAAALAAVMRDRDLRHRLTEGARARRGRLLPWAAAAARFAAVLDGVAARG